MTMSKLPGLYFSESVESVASAMDSIDDDVCFILESSIDIPALDGKLTEIDGYESLRAACEGKNLGGTLKFIKQVLTLTNISKFYVYSIKSSNADGWKDIIESNIHLKNIRKFIYFEEKKSAAQFTLNNKLIALKNACENVFEYGAFRVCIAVPYGTINDAADKAENTTPEVAVCTAYESVVAGVGSGRIIVVNPDLYINQVATIINSGYTQDAGFAFLDGVIDAPRFNFTYEQMVTLQNLGVCFAKQEKINGEYWYRINLAVTTSFKESLSDGLIIDRLIADELLHRIDEECDVVIKYKDMDFNIKFLQTIVNTIIDEFASDKLVDSKDTKLTVSDAGNMVGNITGQIKTVPSLNIIEVKTTLA